MLLSRYFVLFINIFSLVTVQSHESTGKIHDVVTKNTTNDSRVGPTSGSKVRDNGKMGDIEDGNARIMYDYDNHYGNAPHDFLKLSQTGEESSDSDSNEATPERETDRSFQTGDTCTPMELLPICIKLLAKVRIGEGKGIVSSSKTPEALADKIFTGYFLTTRRIVYLKDLDIPGLDALQALALEGEDVNTRTSGNSITESPYRILNYRGQNIGLDNGPKKCHYKLISKKVNATDAALRKGKPKFNKVLKMEKLLSPNRHVIVNYESRKTNNKTIKFQRGVDAKNKTEKQENVKTVTKKGKGRRRRVRVNRRKLRKNGRRKAIRHKVLQIQRLQKKEENALPITTTRRPSACKWRYICRDPADLDTCRLHSSCHNEGYNKPMIDNNRFVDHKARIDHEQNRLLLHFRKMLGLTAIDEEVEKIIEKHVVMTSPANMNPDQKIETIDEYFQGIIMAQNAQSTTPYATSEETTYTPHHMAAVVSDLKGRSTPLPSRTFT